MATYFLDVEGGNDAADGTSFANRVKTLTVASNLLAPGDTLRLMQAYAPNSLGINGTFVRGSTKITLASAVTQLLYAGNSAGTVSSNVTYTSTTTRKSSTAYAQIAIASGFTTGKAWYFDFGATDLSGYQQLSFWMQMTTGTLAANLSFRICSDATGDVSVDSFTIPACGATNQWHRVVINLGSAMSASARTLALYVDSDQGAQTVIIGNVNACKAPGTGELHLKTLIGKADSLGAGGDESETWYPIRAIEGTTVTLETSMSQSAGSSANGKYWGVSETVTAYSMVPCYLPLTTSATDLYLFCAGTSGSRITVSGGWNRTDMSTQTGHTWLATISAASLSTVFNISCVDLSKTHFSSFPSGHIWYGEAVTLSDTHVMCGGAINFGLCESTVASLVNMNSPSNTLIGSFGSTISSLTCCNDNSGQLVVTGVGNIVAMTDVVAFNSTNQAASIGNKITYNAQAHGLSSPSQIADHVLRRTMANVEASTDGDTLSLGSLYGCTQQAQESSVSGTTLTVKKTDGSTTLGTKTLTLTADADPIRGVA